MAGDDSGLGVRRERDDSVSGLSQDGAGFLTTQDPLRGEQRGRGQSLTAIYFNFFISKCERTLNKSR